MRLLYWVQQYWPYIGGVEVVGVKLLAELRARGYDVLVVTSHGEVPLPDEDEHQGIPIHRFPFQTILAPPQAPALSAALRAVAELKRRFRPDAIHLNLTDPSIFFHLHTRAAHPAPFIASIRLAVGPAVGDPQQSLMGRALRSADWVTANSGAMLAEVRAICPEITPRSSLIYERIKAPALQPAPLPFAPPRLLCLGRVVDEKGFDLAVAAFGELAGRFPTARLIIAGDGPARPALERQAHDLGLADRVEFTGWIDPDQVPALINSTTLMIVPSRWEEAFGQVALQAAQMGRPVVAANVGGLPEIVAEGENGLLFEREDSHGLAEAVARLLAHPAHAQALGRAGQARAETRFGWASYVEAYDQLYRSIAANN